MSPSLQPMPDTNQPELTPAQVRAWLGPARFARYRAASGGDEGLALRLYQWNSQVAAAALVDVGHFEVALRNAYDRQLSSWFPNWTIDPRSALFTRTQGHPAAVAEQRRMNERSLRDLTQARRGLGSRPSHGQVLASLSFGFWAQMSARARTSTFWVPMIRHAYPAVVSAQVRHVHDLVQNVVGFRNRLAHGERVFSTQTGLLHRMDDVATLFRMLHPEAAAWTERYSTVDPVLARCPVPNLMPPTERRGPLTVAQLAALSSSVQLGASRSGRTTRSPSAPPAQQPQHPGPTL